MSKPEFSKQAGEYARHRPRYPEALFDYLASLAPARDVAWDCGTGNGQAALGLARHFASVVATDASAEQIAHATPHPKVTYRVSPAERTVLPDRSVDLVTVAQALHWFDLEAFYSEVRRVLRQDGVLAAWTYTLPAIDPGVDGVVARFFDGTLRGYWAPGRRYVDEQYRTIPFPFPEEQAPAFAVETLWTLDDLTGFFTSWSARQKFIAERGYDPIDDIRDDLAAAWGDPARQRTARWPLYFRIGRVPAG